MKKAILLNMKLIIISFMLIMSLGGCNNLTSNNQNTPTSTSATNTPAQISPSADPSQGLNFKIDEYIKTTDFQGTIIVAQKGTLITESAYGYADIEGKIPNSVQTRFHIGSLTKQFTAMAILQLDYNNKLHLYDHLCSYIDSCPLIWTNITIHQLLTHSSGIPGYTAHDVPFATHLNVEELISRFKDKNLDFEPGLKYKYSNSGYILLGYIIEKVTGKSYRDFLQQNILQPLNMTNTDYAFDTVADEAKGYVDATTNAQFVDLSTAYSAGGLYSTIHDLYLWDQALYSDKLIPQTQLVKMFTPYIVEDQKNELLSYGYGWHLVKSINHPLAWHGGSVPGFLSLLERYYKDDVTIIILTNIDKSKVSIGKIGKTIEGFIFKAN